MSQHRRSRLFLKQWRIYRGLSQERLAMRLGTSKGHISNLEAGKARWNEDHLAAWADALDCDPVDLLIRNPTDPEGIWSIWDRVKPVDRDTARRILEQLAEPPANPRSKASSE
jgi:transcriptional regulator with XRE-family HTH domain